MTGRLSKNFHGVGIGPLSKILAVKDYNNLDYKTKFFKPISNAFSHKNY